MKIIRTFVAQSTTHTIMPIQKYEDSLLTYSTDGKTVTGVKENRITSIIIPKGVEHIGIKASCNCTTLKFIDIPNSVKSIGALAFRGCSNLTSITIPDSVTSIGYWTFADCSGLTSIKVDSANPIYDSRNNCNAIIETSSYELMAGCKNTTIPDSVKSIGSHAFCGCSGLTSINIPEGVTSIGDWAFSDCSNLKSITIPERVTNIEDSTFNNCGCI